MKNLMITEKILLDKIYLDKYKIDENDINELINDLSVIDEGFWRTVAREEHNRPKEQPSGNASNNIEQRQYELNIAQIDKYRAKNNGEFPKGMSAYPDPPKPTTNSVPEQLQDEQASMLPALFVILIAAYGAYKLGKMTYDHFTSIKYRLKRVDTLKRKLTTERDSYKKQKLESKIKELEAKIKVQSKR